MVEFLLRKVKQLMIMQQMMCEYLSLEIPVILICLIAMHNAPRVPHNRFYAMTRLDENRSHISN